MMKSKKTVRDANEVAKLFVSQVEARAKQLECSDKFVIGYLESFLGMHADRQLIDAMESRINAFSEANKMYANKDAA